MRISQYYVKNNTFLEEFVKENWKEIIRGAMDSCNSSDAEFQILEELRKLEISYIGLKEKKEEENEA